MNTCVQTFVWVYASILGGYIPRSGLPGGSVDKESACNVGYLGSIPGLGRSPGGGYGNPIPVFLPGESPWTEESGRVQSMGSQRVDMTEGLSTHTKEWGSPGGTEVKNLPANVGGTRDAGLIPRSGRSPRIGNGI